MDAHNRVPDPGRDSSTMLSVNTLSALPLSLGVALSYQNLIVLFILSKEEKREYKYMHVSGNLKQGQRDESPVPPFLLLKFWKR